MTGTPTLTEAQLVRIIRTLIEKGDKAAAKSEQFYIAAGQHLKTLKEQHTGTWAGWETLLKERCGIGKSRASELMRIADGTKTVEQVRAETGERTRKARETSPLRSGEGREVVVVEQDDDDARVEADRQQVVALFEKVRAAEQAAAAANNQTQDAGPSKSWRVEVLTKDGKRYENGVRLATEEEADRYRMVFDITGFWNEGIIIVGTVVIDCGDDPNCGMERTKKGKITHRLIFPHGGCGWLGWTEVGTETRSTVWNGECSVEQSTEARKREYANAEAAA
jgi:hypothetical protein